MAFLQTGGGVGWREEEGVEPPQAKVMPQSSVSFLPLLPAIPLPTPIQVTSEPRPSLPCRRGALKRLPVRVSGRQSSLGKDSHGGGGKQRQGEPCPPQNPGRGSLPNLGTSRQGVRGGMGWGTTRPHPPTGTS